MSRLGSYDSAMDADRFANTVFGYATREPGKTWSFTYYLPRSIPRSVDLSATVVRLLSDADAALGHLQGLGMIITDPSLLIGPSLRREALASSRIEGTQASLSELLQSEVDDSATTDDTAEVSRYLAATQQAFDLSAELPITQRLILAVHRTLMAGVRGEERSPGEFRRSPVWVGHAGATPTNAVFVPPLPHHLGDLLADWERFVNDDGRHLPALVQAALMHYQFETIHPFLDGNGRIGRLLINLVLTARDRLDLPLLYLSSYFESHRDQYYQRLQRVRETGDVESWLRFFLAAVQAQARDAIDRSRKLVTLRESYTHAATRERSSLVRLVDLLISNPYVTVHHVQSRLALTNQGARNVIRRAEAKGWLQSLDVRGRGGRARWFAPDILEIMEMPMEYESAPSA